VNAQPINAIFFDVDFTLIYPGPTFQGEGYARFCARHGIAVDQSRFGHAVRAASSVLDEAQEHVYDGEIFVRYTGRIIQEMGGTGPAVADCAREIYDEWAENQHFFLYDDVEPVLRELSRRGLKLGLISNSHRPLESFQQHFELDGLIAAAVSSSEHGYMKPHPSIFTAALTLAGVQASESMMVGDSLLQDVEGARRIGMRGVLLVREGAAPPQSVEAEVPTISDLTELERYL